MTRLALLIFLAIATWCYFPQTRAILLDVAEPVVVPILRWSAEEEMGQVGRNVVEHERLTGQVPAGVEWLGWLDYRYVTTDAKQDPWGGTYQLLIWKDSVGILSLGPDRIRTTADDFYVVTPRG
jgi:hypothetical protein